MRVLCLLLLMATAAGAESLGVEADAIMRPLVRVSTSFTGGSGVVLYSEDRENAGEHRTFVLTNHHVVSDAIHVLKKWDSLTQSWYHTEENDQVTVELFMYLRSGRTVVGQPIKANIRAHREEQDLALLELDYPTKIDHVATLLPEGEELKLLQQVWAVGCSLGEDPLVTTGHITDLETIIDHKPYIMASAQIIYGNSGGGVFTRRGGEWYFVGVPSRIRVTLSGQAMTHMGYFITPARVRDFCENQKLDFLLCPEATPTACFEAREALKKGNGDERQ